MHFRRLACGINFWHLGHWVPISFLQNGQGEHKLGFSSSFFFGAPGETTAPQESLQVPDDLEVVSSPQVSRQGAELLLTTLTHLPFATGPWFLSRTRAPLWRWELFLLPCANHSLFLRVGKETYSCVCLVPPVPQPGSLGDRAVEMADGWISVFFCTPSSSVLRKHYWCLF